MSRSELTSGRLLARNTGLNFVAQGVLLLVALIAIPLLVKGLGTERFGIFILIWTLIGYFGLLDLGLGRAMTQAVAEILGKGNEEELPAVAWTGLLLTGLLGIVGATLLLIFVPWLVTSGIKTPPFLQEESRTAFYLLALSLPFVLSPVGLRGLLEAHQRFDLTVSISMPMAVVSFLSPLLVLPFSRSLDAVVAVLLVGRIIGWLAHLVVCLRTLPYLRGEVVWNPAVLAPLFRRGAWMTVSNVISPAMVYLDRFVIGAMLSLAAVAYYVTPYEIVTKLWMVPGAVLSVMFPAFAMSFAKDQQQTAALFDRAMRTILLIVFPLALVLVVFAPEGLSLWLGQEFSRQSTGVVRWLAVAVFVNCCAQVAFAVLQGVGRPDLTAKLHLLELVPYIVALWWLVGRFGITGAAVAWALRVLVDTVILFGLAKRQLPAKSVAVPKTLVVLAGALCTFGVAVLLQGLIVNATFVAFVLLNSVVLGWRQGLTAEERRVVRSLLPGMREASSTP
ncbi:O13/O129/O135 family O-antigen flippase [soil metagenome]